MKTNKNTEYSNCKDFVSMLDKKQEEIDREYKQELIQSIGVYLICIFMATLLVILLYSALIMIEPKTSKQTKEVYEIWEVTDTLKMSSTNIGMYKYINDIKADVKNKREDKIKAENKVKENIKYNKRWVSCRLNFRQDASTKSDILFTVDKGTEISVTEYNKEWSYGKYKGKHVYVYTKYLSKVKIEKQKYIKKQKYSDRDLYELSHLIMGESGGESDKCQLYVGSVVLNRVKSNKFPNTIHEVIFQKGQYACTWDGNFNKTPTEQCIKNAKYLLEHGSMLPEYVIFQSGFKQGNNTYTVVDGEYFCY